MFFSSLSRNWALASLIVAGAVLLVARVRRGWVSDEQAAAEGAPETAGERRLSLPTPRWERVLRLAISTLACAFLLRRMALESLRVVRGGDVVYAFGGLAAAAVGGALMCLGLWHMAERHLPHISGRGLPSLWDGAGESAERNVPSLSETHLLFPADRRPRAGRPAAYALSLARLAVVVVVVLAVRGASAREWGRLSPTQWWVAVAMGVAAVSVSVARFLRRRRFARETSPRSRPDPVDLPMPLWERGALRGVYAVPAVFILRVAARWALLIARGEAEWNLTSYVFAIMVLLLVPLLGLRSWQAARGRRARFLGRHWDF